MNYLELINKCLVELNYKQVSSFSELTKNDHKKLKNILNVLNAEVCGSDRWSFLLRKQQLTIPANTGEVTNSIDGRIETVIVDGVKFDYYEDFEKFFTNAQPMHTYSLFNDKILFPVLIKRKLLKLFITLKIMLKMKTAVKNI